MFIAGIKETPHMSRSSSGASRPDHLRSGSGTGRTRPGGGVERVLDPYFMTEAEPETEEPAEFKIRRPLTTKELTRKIKKHQAAVRRERRRFIAGAERPPVSGRSVTIFIQ